MSTTAIIDHRSLIDLSLSLSGWVSQLVERFPDFDEYDISAMVEEKIGLPMDQEDFQSIRAYFLRAKLKAWSPDCDDPNQ